MATNLDKAQTVGESLEFGIGGPGITKHSGSPEGAVTAPIGSLVLRTDDGSTWKKVSGAGNTGWVDASSGSTSGYPNINYITNYGAESDVSGASAYADTAGSAPIDATGGSPTVTITRTTSSPQRGTASYLMTKDSVNRQGEGFSIPFTIDSADKAAMLQIGADIIVGSGTFNAGSNTTDSDATVWIYDVTNSSLIQPTNHKIFSNSSTLSFPYSGTFQASPDSTSYRLIFHVGTTNASAWTLKVDNVVVGPMLKTITSAVSDWQAFPSVAAGTLITATTTSPTYGTVAQNVATWRRVGDSMEIVWDYRQTSAGTGGSGTYLFNLPAGYSIDLAWLAANTTSPFQSGVGTFDTVRSTTIKATGNVKVYSASQLAVHLATVETASSSLVVAWGTSSANAFDSNAAMTYNLRATVKIAGWGSNIELNSMDSNRPVHARYTGTISASVSTTLPIQWATKDYDTHSAVTTGSSWKFTAPVSGKYSVKVSGNVNTASQNISLYKNGTAHTHITYTTSNGSFPGGTEVYLNAGDYIDIRNATGSDTVAALSTAAIVISLLDSATQIGANETVAASYYCSANQSASTSTPVNFDTKIYDSHNMVTTGSGWKLTAPYPGRYAIVGFLGSGTAGIWMRLYKNGSLFNGSLFYLQSTSGVSPVASSIQLLAGDYIDIRPDSSITLNGGALTSSNVSNIHIFRIGN